MTKKIKHLTKTLQFSCSDCSNTYQLVEIVEKLRSKQNNYCLDNCLTNWQQLLYDYHQDQIFAYLAKKEQEKELLTEKLQQIRKQNKHF